MATPEFQEKKVPLERALNSAFSPHKPIDQARFFAGRTEQVRSVVDAIRTPGLHAAIYGERGVGKTSLAGIIKEFLEEVIIVSRVNCGHEDTFDAIVRRGVEDIHVSAPRRAIGFRTEDSADFSSLVDRLPIQKRASPDKTAAILAELPPFCLLVFDEFDRLPRAQTALVADLLKSLSDRGAPVTILLVGVAEDINRLIESHASVERCLRQIRLPRMSDDELGLIIDVGLRSAEFTIDSGAARTRIISSSQGFPHYTHLLALNAARTALDSERTQVSELDVINAMVMAVDRAEQSQRDAYYAATTGTKKKNLWKEVVAACALAESDERGYFSSRAVQERLSGILGRPVIQQTVAFHLGKLTEESRGRMLERVGQQRRYRYRFMNPLMRPFIAMKAIRDGFIAAD